MQTKKPVYLIDGSAYIYRAYHAISPLSNSKGLPTHAVYGFVNILLRVMREKKPHFMAIAFDMKGPTFRHELFPSYKANRPPMPDDLVCQIPYIKKISRAMNILCLEKEGFEADDLLASSACRLAETGNDVVILSGDKDLLQLVSDKIVLWDPMSDRLMDRKAVTTKYNVGPEKLNDLFALIGDSSDNVPGVPGVGPKTADKLINEFGSLENLYKNIDQLTKKKLKENLATFQEQAMLSRKLIALKENIDVPGQADAYLLPESDQEALYKLYAELEFSRLMKEEAPVQNMATDSFSLVTDINELDRICQTMSGTAGLVLDTETTSLDPLSAELVGISLCFDDTKTWYIPVGHRNEEKELVSGQIPLDDALACLRPVFENSHISKTGHNIKYDYAVLEKHGITLHGPLRDTMIASYLLDPSRRSHKLDDLASEHLGLRLTPFAEVTENDKRPEAFSYVGLSPAKDYSCEDAAATLLLWNFLSPQLEEFNLVDLFEKIEMPLVPLLADMEKKGILVDTQILAEMSEEFAGTLALLEEKIFSLAGEPFNINSPKQLGTILFDTLQLPHGRKTKTGYSTDVKVLEKLSAYHELPASVLEHRTLSKLKSTYVDKLATLVHPRTGRVHTSFNQTVTATGRLSSSNPNLQNIPIRTPEGQRIRQAFIADKGKTLLAADYSQIDLRVLAHYSGDQALIAAFTGGKDVHNQTAAEIFRVHSALITPQMRRVAKSINFGIVYGMSAFGLAGQLNLSRKEAQTFINRYFDLYSGVKQFMEDIVEQARKDGFVTTLLHRRRMVPDINSTNKTRREFAERTALNTPIQGTAADIIKLATLEADRKLRQNGLTADLLLQIHDELVFEVPVEELRQSKEVIQQAMENVMKLAVPLTVNLSDGPNLAETK